MAPAIREIYYGHLSRTYTIRSILMHAQKQREIDELRRYKVKQQSYTESEICIIFFCH